MDRDIAGVGTFDRPTRVVGIADGGARHALGTLPPALDVVTVPPLLRVCRRTSETADGRRYVLPAEQAAELRRLTADAIAACAALERFVGWSQPLPAAQ